MKSKKETSENIISLPKSLWAFYWKYGMKGQKLKALGWYLSVMLAFSGGFIFPMMERWIVDIFEKPLPAGMGLLEHATPTIILIIVLNMMMTIASILQATFRSHLLPYIKRQVSEVMTTYIHNQTMSFWVNRMSGKINSQIGYVERIADAGQMLVHTTGHLMIILVNGGLLFAMNKYVAMLFIFALGFRIIYAYRLRNKVKKASEEASGANSNLNGQLVDSFSNYTIVKLFAGAKKEQQALVKPRDKYVETTKFSQYTMRLFWAIPTFLWDILYGSTIFFCVVLYQRGILSVAEVVYTLSVFYNVMGSISNIINTFPEIIDQVASAKKAYKELVVPIDITDKENAKNLVVKNGGIEFKNIYFKYKNKYVLKDLSLAIKPGERVGIVGSSGAGKTTLVNLLMRFYEPQKGEIVIDNQNINDVKQNSLRENIAFIPQEPTMFNRTIAENIGYGKFGASKEEIRRAAKFASADKFIMETEKKYDSIVGDKGIKLSGGQRQRIAIARAFLKNAPILVLDEATSALDSETEIAIQKSFDKLSKGRTTIAIAHRLSTLRNMDRIVVIDKGVIVEQGTHSALLRKKGKYYHLWQMQSGGFLQEK
ncbi:MAG: ABC transporter ATP-binding protein [Alphaproteobacteria bacterium]|nr:ABC transporter ATP-binding protein [Alphaproteobacteria bacterium]